MKLPLIGPAVGNRPGITARRAENIRFEQRPGGEKAGVVAKALPRLDNLWTAPGTVRMLSPSDDNINALILVDGNLSRVSLHDNPLVQVQVSAVTGMPHSTVPTVETFDPRAAHGHDGWVVTSGHTQYVSSNGVGGLMHTMPDGRNARAVVYHRGYYLLGAHDRIYWVTTTTGAPAALAFSGLDLSRDHLVDLVDIGPAVAVFSRRTIEFFAVSASASNPFMPVQEAGQRIGVAHNKQIRKVGETVYFWGVPDVGTPGLFAMQGMRYERISTQDLEDAVMADPYRHTDLAIDGWMWGGHPIIKLTGNGRTVLYDVAMQCVTTITDGADYNGRSWSIGVNGNVVTAHATTVGVHRPELVASTIPRSLTTDHVVSDLMDRFPVDNARLDCEGMGPIRLEYSRNGGQTWRDAGERDGAMAALRRVQWNRFGTGRQFTFRLSATGAFNVSNFMLQARN